MATIEKKNEITRSQAMAFAIENLEGIATPEMMEVLNKIKTSIERKSVSKKDEEKAKNNEILSNAIVLEMEKGVRYTVSTMIQSLPSMAGMTVSKATYLLKKPVADGTVAKDTEKGRSVYFLA